MSPSTATLGDQIYAHERQRRVYSGLLLILLVAILVSGYWKAESMNSGDFLTGLTKFFEYPGEIVREAWDAGGNFFPLLIKFLPALIETLNIALVATLLGGFFATILAFLSTRNLQVWPPLIPIVRRAMDFMRAFPELIVALFLIFVLGSSPVPAMIAVAFHTTGALGKLFSEVNENIDRKPIEGLTAVGAGWLQKLRYAVLPQVGPNYLSYFLLRLEINVRASAILGFVGAGGIGAELRRTIGWGQGAGDETAALFLLLFMSIMAIDQLSSYLRGRLTGAHEHKGKPRNKPSLDATRGSDRRGIGPHIRGKAQLIISWHILVLAYFAYAWFAFDVPTLLERAKPERALLLATDSVAYKVHVTKLLRRERLQIAIEGERTSQYKTPPSWVKRTGNDAVVNLGDGYLAEIEGKRVRFSVPNYGTIQILATKKGVEVKYPPSPRPDWIRGNRVKFDARPTLGRRVQVSESKIEIHRYFLGWENFWFPFRSELHGKSFSELVSLALSSDRLRPDQSNLSYMVATFLNNPDWQHGEVFQALFETILMAVLGTLTATIFGMPLAFLAASNFTPSMILRFGLRRLFDFLRGIDMLIWSLIFIRAFGLGPLTGALAIAFTDTGTFGKLYSEALENIDNRQVEGVTATGANRLQRYRFGVIPQILPVFLSQALYYLESNTRSATVIGALGAGGIGLLLVETMRTSRDWENTLYIIVLTIIVVTLMDMISGWLRRRLIGGKEVH